MLTVIHRTIKNLQLLNFTIDTDTNSYPYPNHHRNTDNNTNLTSDANLVCTRWMKSHHGNESLARRLPLTLHSTSPLTLHSTSPLTLHSTSPLTLHFTSPLTLHSTSPLLDAISASQSTGRLNVGDATKIQPSTSSSSARHFTDEILRPKRITANAAVEKIFNCRENEGKDRNVKEY